MKLLDLILKLNEFVIQYIQIKASKPESGTNSAELASISMEFANMVMIYSEMIQNKSKADILKTKLSEYIAHAKSIQVLVNSPLFTQAITEIEKQSRNISIEGGIELNNESNTLEYYIGGYLVTGGDRFEDLESWIKTNIQHLSKDKYSERYRESILKPLAEEVNEFIKMDNHGELESHLVDKWLSDNVADVILHLTNLIQLLANYLKEKKPAMLNKGPAIEIYSNRIDLIIMLLKEIDKRDKKILKQFAQSKSKPPDNFQPNRREFKEKISKIIRKIIGLLDINLKTGIKLNLTRVSSKSIPLVKSALETLDRYLKTRKKALSELELIINKLASEADSLIVTVSSMIHPDNYHTCVKNISQLPNNRNLIGEFNF